MSRATSSSKKVAAAKASKLSGHPSWVDMIKECIVAHPEEARAGVSRPTIKKFVETKYKVDLNTSATSQLSRAIVSGSEKGTFVLPKGPSGKVKLAPKIKAEVTKDSNKTDKEDKKVSKPIKDASNKTAPKASKATKSSSTAKEARIVIVLEVKSDMKAQSKTVKSSTAPKPAKKAPAKMSAAKKPTATKSRPAVKKTSTKKIDAKKTVAKAAASKSKKPASKAAASKGKPLSKAAASKKPSSSKSMKPVSKATKSVIAKA
ncbi:hypothetical protein EW145_g2866 [Phellinidium pouzarii]|uniref:Histone H1 n=1 Tax=Phellinidium pouzarii TaxID=167371 RepID=A0A4S4L9F9_9AGAM|nr:hypothetical protein EW145_g2866 [Phellinidium pouzarii]